MLLQTDYLVLDGTTTTATTLPNNNKNWARDVTDTFRAQVSFFVGIFLYLTNDFLLLEPSPYHTTTTTG